MMLTSVRRWIAALIAPQELPEPVPMFRSRRGDVVAFITLSGGEAGAVTKEMLITLAETLAAHQGVTHFAISMRALGKGDFFKKLMAGGDCRTATAARVLAWFDQGWPGDLEWPRDVPRPPKQKKEAA